MHEKSKLEDLEWLFNVKDWIKRLLFLTKCGSIFKKFSRGREGNKLLVREKIFLNARRSCQNNKESGWGPKATRKPKTREVKSNGVCPGEYASLHQPSICIHTSTEIRFGTIARDKEKLGKYSIILDYRRATTPVNQLVKNLPKRGNGRNTCQSSKRNSKQSHEFGFMIRINYLARKIK